MEYDTHAGDVKKTSKGAIISTAAGNTTAYALQNIETKGPLFVGINVPVYQGMVIGEHLLDKDMEMNPVKAKELNNIRTKGSEDQIKLIPARIMGLEASVSNLRNDELVEVTPKWIRIRKRILDQGARLR
jgi:GTP-binding protein